MSQEQQQRRPDFSALQVGDTLPPLALPVVDRTMLALFAGASGDHNRIHIDTDYARRAGMPDVFAHGMLSMAFLGRLVTSWVPQKQVRGLGTRFTSITWVGDVITVSGKVTGKREANGEKLVDLEYHFQRWRFGHLKTVERIIGFKRGTGGTAGVPYLESVLKQVFFPELLSVRTAI